MNKIPAFEITRWVDKYEHSAKFDLGGSCCPILSVEDLVNLSTDPDMTEKALSMRSMKLNYGSMLGSDALRENIAATYPRASLVKENILTSNGGIGANNIALTGLLGPGDHVICIYPTYEQLYQTPRAMGAEVTLWKLDVSTGEQLNIEFLKSVIRPNTKMIVLNNPSNPTGVSISENTQHEIVEVAREHAIILMVDEVFRPLFHVEPAPPSFIELGYGKTVVTGSMSKAYGLAGTRTGWLATKDPEMMAAFITVHDYTNISVAQIGEMIAAEALSSRCNSRILQRNIRLAATNLEIMDDFIQRNSRHVQWARPKGASITLLRFCRSNGEAVDDVMFCLKLLEETGVC